MIQADFSNAHTDLTDPSLAARVAKIHERLHHHPDLMCGWVQYPFQISDQMLDEIIKEAEAVRHRCSVFIVIGIGGSYLGTVAGMNLLRPPFDVGGTIGNPRIIFAGQHLSSHYYNHLMTILEDPKEEICACMVSKSGSTTEPKVIYAIIKEALTERYGNKVNEHITIITDPRKGYLQHEAAENGYRLLNIPEDIGGRYSVLTAVGLFPLAVAGIDIKSIIRGARQSATVFMDPRLEHNDCYQYAATRYLQSLAGKRMEIFEVYEGNLLYFTEWLRQLFAESECKDGKGLFPAAMQMTTDLHSLGQFLQEGRQDFIETVLFVKHIEDKIKIPAGVAGNCTSLHCLNDIIRHSVCTAHQANRTPNILLNISEISAFTFGEIVYFFEKACAMSCYLTGVDPFNQPGVENYKTELKENITSMINSTPVHDEF